MDFIINSKTQRDCQFLLRLSFSLDVFAFDCVFLWFLKHGLCTFRASFMSKSLTVDNITIKFQIWDTAGQERVRVDMRSV